MKLLRCLSLFAILAVVMTAIGSTPVAASSRALARGSFGAGAESGVTGSGTTTVVQKGGDVLVNLNRDFTVTSGPSLTVWLSPDSQTWVDGAIKLGELQSETGRSVYQVESEVNLRDIASVVIWCEEFDVLFSVAPLRWEDQAVVSATGSIEATKQSDVRGIVNVVEQGGNTWVDLLGVELVTKERLEVWLTTSIEEPSNEAILLGTLKPATSDESFKVDVSNLQEPLPGVILLWDAEAQRAVAWSQTESIAPPEPAVFEARVVASGSFGAGEESYFGTGTVQIIEVTGGSFVVSLLGDFSVTPGPALVVMLSPSPSYYADGAITLGGLFATAGAQEYAVPAGVDPTVYGSVIIWCSEFSVLFSAAPLA